MWIWNLEKEHFPGATHIVDLFHAREHLGCLAKLLAPVLGEDRAAWLVDRKDELDAGDIPAILAAGRAFDVPAAKAGDLDTTLGYFQTNACRMRYKTFRGAGHFVGSGAVEAGYKAVIGQSPQTLRHALEQCGALLASSPCAARTPAGGRRTIWKRPPTKTSVA